MTAKEKTIGIETMKARILAFHTDRLTRLNDPRMAEKLAYFNPAGWSRSKIVAEFRELPENQKVEPLKFSESHIPNPKSDAEMAEIVKVNGMAALMG